MKGGGICRKGIVDECKFLTINYKETENDYEQIKGNYC